MALRQIEDAVRQLQLRDGERAAADRAFDGRLQRVEGGTTAERDAIYGVPATDAERVALANRRPLWFNVARGWHESYYAPASLGSALTVPGLQASVAAGWYPTGRGPFVVAEATAQFGASSNNYVGNWHNGLIHRNDGGEWFDVQANGLIRVKVAGFYDVQVWTTQVTGSGTANYHLRHLNSTGGTLIRAVDGNAFQLNASLYTRAHMESYSEPIRATEQLGMFCHSGSLTVHMGSVAPRAQFVVTYLRPLLANS